VSTELRHHFFSERVINIWNSFDNRTVTSGSISIFKGNLERLRQSKEIDLFCWHLMLLVWSNEAEPCCQGGLVRKLSSKLPTSAGQ